MPTSALDKAEVAHMCSRGVWLAENRISIQTKLSGKSMQIQNKQPSSIFEGWGTYNLLSSRDCNSTQLTRHNRSSLRMSMSTVAK